MINISYYLIILIKINTQLTNIDPHSDLGGLGTIWSTGEKSVRIYSRPNKKKIYICQRRIHIGTRVVSEPPEYGRNACEDIFGHPPMFGHMLW